MAFQVNIDARSFVVGLVFFIILAFVVAAILYTLADNIEKTGINVSALRNTGNMLIALAIIVIIILIVIFILRATT